DEYNQRGETGQDLKEDMIDLIGAGRGLYIHSSHGQVNRITFGWGGECHEGEPPQASFWSSQVEGLLSNSLKYPFMMALACSTAEMDNSQSVSVAEAFVNNPTKGSIGYFGAVRGAGYSSAKALINRAARALTIDGAHVLGRAILRAKIGPISRHEEKFNFNLLGDPATDIGPALTGGTCDSMNELFEF
ncbi:C25 family cysteine peptidase, partial [Candidatus Omnitrophota bacterium]